MTDNKRLRTFLQPLPNNLPEELKARQKALADHLAEVQNTFKKPKNGRPPNYRSFKITATTAHRALPEGALNFNPRVGGIYNRTDAVLFVRDKDLANGKLKDGAPREPLILRIAAGDWLEIQLTNDLGDDGKDDAFKIQPDLGAGSPFQGDRKVLLSLSKQAGLHPALVGFDATKANGVNVGFNPDSTVPPPNGGPSTKSFYWYAGDLSIMPERDRQDKLMKYRIKETPIEYGATNLVPADLMVQPQFGMVGALVVEPEGSRWVEDTGTRASATVTPKGRTPFREFVVVMQNAVMPNQVANTGRSGFGAINYRTEPFLARGVNVNTVLQFQSGPALPVLGPQTNVKGEKDPVWGTASKDAPAVLAQATVRSDAPAGTTLLFFSTQIGRPMKGSLVVQGARDKATTITIEGTVLGGKPAWVVDGKPADKVAVSPGDSVIWKAVMDKHGVVFDTSPLPGPGFAKAFSNDLLFPSQDPKTPVFRAAAGTPVRFRLVMPSTSTSNAQVRPVSFAIHGHGWSEEPYTDRGMRIGRNIRSMFLGAQQIAPYEAFNLVIDRAGGPFAVPGDYLYEGFQLTNVQGLWGLFRVEEDLVVIQEATLRGGRLILKGVHFPSRVNRGKDCTITVSSPAGINGRATVKDRSWTFEANLKKDAGTTVDLTVTSSLGGQATVKVSAEAGR
jgi:hypothetical protein